VLQGVARLVGKGQRAWRARCAALGLQRLADAADCLQRLVIVQRAAGTGLGGHHVVEPQGRGRQAEAPLHQRHDAQGRLALRPVEGLTPTVEVAHHLEHEGTDPPVAVVAARTGGRQVPVAAQPDEALGIDGHVLRDVAPAVDLRVVAPHAHHGVMAAEVRPPRAPGVVHVDRIDTAGEGEGVQQVGKLLDGHARKGRLGHGGTPWGFVLGTGARAVPALARAARAGLRHSLGAMGPAQPASASLAREEMRVCARPVRSSFFTAEDTQPAARRLASGPGPNSSVFRNQPTL
jgi:hypothetical protein